MDVFDNFLDAFNNPPQGLIRSNNIKNAVKSQRNPIDLKFEIQVYFGGFEQPWKFQLDRNYGS